MSGPLHALTDFDVEREATTLVSRIEAEALDEEMVYETLSQFGGILAQRMQYAQDKLRAAMLERIADKRAERLKHQHKGVQPAVPGGDPKIIIPKIH